MMRFHVVFACAMLLLVAREATAGVQRVPRQDSGGLGSYYYYRAPAQTHQAPVYAPQMTNTKSSSAVPTTYHKYVPCVARHFVFEECSLCFCTDLPNISLCWDYEPESCEETKGLVEEQKGAVNRDPNGIW